MTSPTPDVFGARASLATASGSVTIYRLDRLGDGAPLPYSIKVLLESALRNCDGRLVTAENVQALAGWQPKLDRPAEVPFMPARVILQDFTGVPAIVDLAAMRSAMARMGGDPSKINPIVPVDLVIDHSVQVDRFGTADALDLNVAIEFDRNRERYEFLRWGQKAFRNLRIVPPATGIVHQVNLEYLASCVATKDGVAFPDTLVGTDSHTTMINGLGVLGWGVGGIEAEAVMLGQPIYMLIPQVVGVRLTGRLAEGVTATDLVLTVTQMLRQKGVVGKFVEFFGPGLDEMGLADRATVANMAPEYGATIGFFPVDEETLRYLRQTNRPAHVVDLVERYCKEQGLFRTRTSPDPLYSELVELDLGTVEASLAGPKRPQDRVPLGQMKQSFSQALEAPAEKRGFGLAKTAVAKQASVRSNGHTETIGHGAVVIAAITSCTNTSNPSVMLGAGLLAQKAVERGLRTKPWVKTSLAPGSRVVTSYLEAAGLAGPLGELGFHTVGYGCTTCIGNSGPLPEAVARAVADHDLVAAAVLSGNRNFEGRVHPQVRANYLASPPLVVAYALAGTVDIDLASQPLGNGKDGRPVFLKDIWPTRQEIQAAISRVVTPETFARRYADVFTGSTQWNAIASADTQVYGWSDSSTYIQEPPFFLDLPPQPTEPADIRSARVLLKLGDSVTTDHISPAGSIKPDSPAGRYLIERNVPPPEFNSYGARRGNDRVMTRGTFANIRIRNQLGPGTEGGITVHLPSGRTMSVHEAAEQYQQAGTPLVVLAGTEYGTGSSRDWAAKGAFLLGIRAVIARSFERIHRSNLVGMGVLPLEFEPGSSHESLGLSGRETFDIEGISSGLSPLQPLLVRARAEDGSVKDFRVTCRIDTPVEVDYYRNGGILQTVLRGFLRSRK